MTNLMKISLWLQFSTDCPSDINVARWRGILKFFERFTNGGERIDDYKR